MNQNHFCKILWLFLLYTGICQNVSAVNPRDGMNNVNTLAAQEGKSYVNEPASVIWNFNTTIFGNADTVIPTDGFSLTAVNTGDLEITGTGKRTADDAIPDVVFVKLKPSGSTNAVEWQLKPSSGLTFTPTKVSGYIQRFGTDVENGVTVSGKLSDGTIIQLGNFTAPRANHDINKDKYGSNSNYTNQFVIELTAEQQEALSSSNGFTLMATLGVSSSKECGFSDIRINGLLNGTITNIEKYALTVAADPAEGGKVSAYPNATEYESGTEVTLTATKNFGYQFVNWTDEQGNVVSEEAQFVYPVTANSLLTAH